MKAHLGCDASGTNPNHAQYFNGLGKPIGSLRTLLIILLLFIVPKVAVVRAAEYERDPKREAAIVAELRSRSPEAVPDFEAATAAYDKSDYKTAAAAYRRVLERVPEFDPALRRLGWALVQQGKTAEGIKLAERALAIRESPENLYALVSCLVAPDATPNPTKQQLKKAYSLIAKAVAKAPKDPNYLSLQTMIALQLDNRSAFESSLAQLRRQAPNHMNTHYFAAIAAAMNEQWLTAEHEIREAGRLGLPADAVQSFLDTGIGTRALAWRWGIWVAIAAGIWILGLAAMFLTGKILSTITLASIENADPNQPISGGTSLLRTFYRRIVAAAGVYWYVSLPFVAIIVVAVTAAIIYGFFAIGRIPVKILLILVLAAAFSLYAIVRSLFVRVRDDEDPGRAVTEAEAPDLWKLARDVAAVVGTRPVDEIWLTPGTEVAVFERGTARERMNDRARRALILGAGTLENFEQGAFCAVLAHEYGHFSHRDTAGGDVALRVRNGMMAFVVALAKAGFAVWWNLAFQFLRLYDFLFRRISHGATRLQEVLADRVAIQHYGLDAFRDGLTHVIRRTFLFEKLAGEEIEQAIQQERLISNLYSLATPSDPTVLNDLDAQVAKAIQADTTQDDTHPSPKDRFRLGAKIQSKADHPMHGCVWDLFLDPATLTAEMTELVARRVAADTSPATTTQ